MSKLTEAIAEMRAFERENTRLRAALTRVKALTDTTDERWWVQEWGHHAIPTSDIREALRGTE